MISMCILFNQKWLKSTLTDLYYSTHAQYSLNLINIVKRMIYQPNPAEMRHVYVVRQIKYDHPHGLLKSTIHPYILFIDYYYYQSSFEWEREQMDVVKEAVRA
jgi:hypothetical protein